MKVKINGGIKQQKKNEFTEEIYGIMKFACKWMNLEKKHILSKAIQNQRDKRDKFSFISQ